VPPPWPIKDSAPFWLSFLELDTRRRRSTSSLALVTRLANAAGHSTTTGWRSAD